MVTHFIPTPPPLTGGVWRAISRDDLAALVDLATDCFLADGGLHFMVEPEELEIRFFPDSPGRAIGAFNVNGMMLACSAVCLVGQKDNLRAAITGLVQPELRRQGLGAYLMHWSQSQARALLEATAPDQRVMQITTESLTEPARWLYLEHGFELTMEALVMRRGLHHPLPDGRLPDGVTITSWQVELAGQFFQAYDAAFRERPGFPGWTAEEWVDSWTNDNFRPDWSLLARKDGVPLGFLTAAANPPHGFVVQVGVVPVHRRRGLGSALLVEAMQRMFGAGMVSTQLTVKTNNPGAIRAHEQLGFATIGRRARFERTLAEHTAL